MKVILDTNIFSADHTFSKTEMVILKRLCNEKKIELIIPEIILKEFSTQEQEKAEASKKRLLHELKVYYDTVYGAEKNEFRNKINNIQDTLTETNKRIQNRIEIFISETNVTILVPNIDEYKGTFDRYFEGKKPFKAIKSRNDIPDALIFEQIMKIKDNELVFVTNDERLRETVKSEGITVFSSLADFIESDEIMDIIEVKRIDDLLYYVLPQILENEYFFTLFHTALEEGLLYEKVNDEKIPDDNNEGTITGIMGIYPTEFIKDEIIKHGARLFTIPFDCEIDAYLEYYFFKMDFYSFDEDRIKEITIEDWNDHYFQAEEEYLLICKGKLGLQFDLNISSNEIASTSSEKLIQGVKISFSDIKIEIKDF